MIYNVFIYNTYIQMIYVSFIMYHINDICTYIMRYVYIFMYITIYALEPCKLE